MNDCKFEFLEIIKWNLTIEEAESLYKQGVCTVCEDGAASSFDFEFISEFRNCG